MTQTPTDQPLKAVLTGPYGHPYQFIPYEENPHPSPTEALVRLDFSGICHGDVYIRDGGGPAPATPKRPLIGGHEGVGVIIALGGDRDHVQASNYKIGDLVGVAWRSSVCASCLACRVGRENHCEKQVITGVGRDGTFARYITFPLDQLIPLPTSLNLSNLAAAVDAAKICPILCAGLTAYSSLRKMRPEPGKWLAIAGAAGGVGHLAIQYAKVAFGLQVVAIDEESKRGFCMRMGADAFVEFRGNRLVERVREVTKANTTTMSSIDDDGSEDHVTELADLGLTDDDEDGGGADYVLVLSPYQEAYNAAGEYARFGAQIMAIGIGNCSFPLRPILHKSLTIQSNHTGTKQELLQALELSASGKIHTEVEIVPSLRELNQALDRVKAGKVRGKLVVDLR